MRTPLLAAALLLALTAAHATTGARPLAPLPTRAAAPAPALRIAVDTIAPPLTRAEERELRRLEREDALARRRRGEAPAARAYAYDDSPNPFAIAALPTAALGVITFVIATNLWNPGPFVLLSVLAFVTAVVFGAIGLRRARRRGLRHKGLAIAGLTLGIIGAAFYAIVLGSFLAWRL